MYGIFFKTDNPDIFWDIFHCEISFPSNFFPLCFVLYPNLYISTLGKFTPDYVKIYLSSIF